MVNLHPEALKNINFHGKVVFNANLGEYSTFRTGGKCPGIFIPRDISDIQKLLPLLGEKPLVIGRGANILFSDYGTDRYIMFTGGLDNIGYADGIVSCGAGADVKMVCRFALRKKLSGFEFLYGMPGSIGGAVWMNARCYGKSIEDILEYVDYLDNRLEPGRYHYNRRDFSYKHSPFQDNGFIIVAAGFRVTPGNKAAIRAVMKRNYSDRRKKGHYRYPCAGSVFKNNRSFGAPSGKIIENCGLKGLKHGGAQIAPYHANIIINRKGASSSDILYLIEKVEQEVLSKTGFRLEREVQLAGKWNK